MTRPCKLELVHGDAGWFWRFIASNGKELARSSETYKRRHGAVNCAELVTGYDVTHGVLNPLGGTVKYIDERTVTP